MTEHGFEHPIRGEYSWRLACSCGHVVEGGSEYAVMRSIALHLVAVASEERKPTPEELRDQALQVLTGRQITYVMKHEGRPDTLSLGMSGGFKVTLSAYAFQSSYHGGAWKGGLSAEVERTG